MSTAPAGNSSDPPQRASQHTGALAILTATAVGGVIATRINKAPLVLAAGAAALALLQRTRHPAQPAEEPSPAPPAPEPLAEPKADAPVQSQVEQWLSQQISREEQAPQIALSDAGDAPAEPEDDYRPQSLLYDDGEEEAAAFAHTSPFFAELTEPAPRLAPPPTPVFERQPEPAPFFAVPEPVAPSPTPEIERPPELPPYTAFFAPVAAPPALESPPPQPDLPPPPPQSFFAPPSPLTVAESPPSSLTMEDAAWTLGVEPLPSLTEAMPAPAPFSAVASSMFFTAPAQQVVESAPPPPPPPVFSIPVYEGAAFPDEIDVMAPAEPVVHLTPSPPPGFAYAPEPEPLKAEAEAAPTAPISPSFAEELTRPVAAFHAPVEPAPIFTEEAPISTEAPPPEIPVQLAAPGEASFDSPLEDIPYNPWQPQPEAQADAPPTPYVSPFPFHHATSPIVDAEIVLRPRAPMQNTVTAKPKLNPLDFVKKDFAETFDAAPTLDAGEAAQPEEFPPQPPREPRRRSSWRSWWRGD